MEDLKGWYLTACLLFLASFGGFIGSLIRALDGGTKVSWFIVVVETLASAFSGMIMVLFCQAVGFSVQWTGVIVGVCGWFGGRTTMLWMETRIRRIIEGDPK